MASHTRIVLLLVLLGGAALLLWRHLPGRETGEPIGMTEAPCAPSGEPITGRGEDDWAGLCVYRAANQALLNEGAAPEIVMIGDSLTAGWPGLDNGYANRGIGGQASPQVLLRFQQDAVALRPRIVHILVGVNDVAGNTGPTAPGMYRANIRAMVEMARANDIEPILATIPPLRDFYWKPGLDPGPWVPRLNRWIRRFAGEQDITLADYHAVLANPDDTIRQALYADGAHPNEAGYRAMRPVLMEAIATARAKRETASR